MGLELEKNKRYYKISEVAKLFDLNASTLRHWEEQFPSLRPSKNNRGDRRYNQADIRLIEKIHDLLKNKGYTIAGAKDALNPRKQKERRGQIARLKEIRQVLLELRESL